MLVILSPGYWFRELFLNLPCYGFYKLLQTRNFLSWFTQVHCGPLWCLCFYKSFYLSDTLARTWGPLTVRQSYSQWRLERIKTQTKQIINLISESPQAADSVYQCFDFVHWQPMTVLEWDWDFMNISYPLSLSLLSLYLDLTITTTLPQPDIDIQS